MKIEEFYCTPFSTIFCEVYRDIWTINFMNLFSPFLFIPVLKLRKLLN